MCVCMCVCVCVCVCVCLCVCVFVCVCVRIPLYLRIYEVDFNRAVLIFFCVFLFRIREENNFLWFTDSFLFYVEFSIFEKFIFDFF